MGTLAATLAALGGCALAPPHQAPIGKVGNLIIGGGMLHCSSTLADPSRQCTAPWREILQNDPAFAGVRESEVLFGPVPARAFTYLITPAALRAFEALPERLVARADKLRLAPALARQAGAGPLTAAQFVAVLGGADGALVAAASEVFVERQPAGPRKRQLRSTAHAANADTAAIYRAFVAAAAAASGKPRPTVGVVTASADNPYNDHDLNVSALRSAGAEVVWLPLDGGLRRALDAGDCAHLAIDYSVYAQVGTGRQYLHMDQLFPDLDALRRQACADQGAALNRDLERIDGIFFTGGNQARHLDSLVGRTGPSAQLQILRRRHAAGELVVAGSSAGDAVQAGGHWRGRPVPMIAGGESALALASGLEVAGAPLEEGAERRASYYPGGGLAVFNFGPLDSHFSQRGREGRLARLVSDGGMEYGFGVDENTALLVGRPAADGSTTMAVLGEGGVWVVDLRAASASGAAAAAFSVRGARIHYLHAGDTLRLDRAGALEVALAPGAAGAPGAAAPRSGKFSLAGLVDGMARRGKAEGKGTVGRFELSVSRPAAGRMVRNARGRTSYTGLTLDIQPCAGTCAAQ
ncbi:MAG: cyanophycinase [Pseudomonadota bacterium]